MKSIKVVLGAAALAVATGALAQDVNFGIIATDSAAVQRERWDPLFRDMEKKTGLHIKAYYAPDYNGVIEGMRFNKVQVAWFGNKSAMEAVDRAQGEVFAQVVYADGTMGYKSLIITNKDSQVKSLDDLLKNAKNYSFGNGDPNSTSGYLVPSYYIFAKNNLDAKTAFKVTRNASHGANIAAVLNNQVDAATNNTEEIDKLKASAPDKAAQIRILWTSPLIPSDPFVWRTDLDPAVKAKIKDFFVNYGRTDEEKAILKNIYNYGGFRASSNAQLIPIRQLEMFKDRRKVEADTSMSEAERQKKLAEIDGKLAELGSAK
ncbi:MAG TPA: phosphonate ABC transporter substrate-binding protein [Usitatibacter sp.]|jgi:phosphonate transport system substrate-binding protein|nr:phosphonate ABC transporter substrate-binding protein [Usitatibacter sp.]